MHRVLVLGIGNPDRGDDGVGPMIAAKLMGRTPAGVDIRSRSGDALAVIQDWAGYDAVLLIDAAASLGVPGRIHRVDLATESLPRDLSLASTHAFGLAEALALAETLKLRPRGLVLLAIESEGFAVGTGLSPAVAAALDQAAGLALQEIARLQDAAGIDSGAVLFQDGTL